MLRLSLAFRRCQRPDRQPRHGVYLFVILQTDRDQIDQASWNDSTSCLGDHMARGMFKEQMTPLLGTQCQKRLDATTWPWRPCGVLGDLSLCSLCCALSHGSLGWEHPREHNKVILEHHFDTVCSFSPERSASVWSSSPLVFIC